ncbi:DUF1707 SHOCT-like domain-containing protein [Nocardioides lijunqiniae]|uniref:DUF1707 SHOCT-like domain-containing protein n=1 Tax=Nocardioides lijunqiniae TaxID=2760832 RepID=UPI001877D96A|nr:DUF1707 domain-containing protein [Nocardioides lijunqiniae]
MTGEVERSDGDPGRLRVSDAERHQVAEMLRDAAGDGRIDLAELDERLEAAYAAKTYADLVPITADLPAHRDAVKAPSTGASASLITPGGSREERHFAVMSGVDRSGVWTVPEQLTILCLMGGANLDLRHATYAAREVTITINAIMGGANVIVGPHTHVVVEGTGFMGGYHGPSGLVDPELDADSPTVRIRGFAFWGGVNVERKPRSDPRPTHRHRLH